MIIANLPVSIASLPQPSPATLTDLPFDQLLTQTPQQPVSEMAEATPVFDPGSALAAPADGAEIESSWLSFIGLNPAKTGAKPEVLKATPTNVLSLVQSESKAAFEPAATAETAAETVHNPEIVSTPPTPQTVLAFVQPIEPATDESIASKSGSSDQADEDAAPTEIPSPATAVEGIAVAFASESRPVSTNNETASVPQESAVSFAGKGEDRLIDLRPSDASAAIAVSTANVSSKPSPGRAEPGNKAFGVAEADIEAQELTIANRAVAGVIGNSAGSFDLIAPEPVTVANINAAAPPASASVARPDPVAALAERQLDLARDTRWIDELARDIVASSGRSDRLSFTLVPPQLGQLNIDLSQSDQGLAVRMNSESEATTQIVTAAQPRLVEELKTQGIRVASTEVATGSSQSGGSGQQQNHHPRNDNRPFEFAWPHFDGSEKDATVRPTGRFA